MFRLALICLGLIIALAPARAEEPNTEVPERPPIYFPTVYTCDITQKIFEMLGKTHNEEPIAIGKGLMMYGPTGQFISGSIMLWKNDESLDWTLTITPDNDASTTCVVMSGAKFTPLKTVKSIQAGSLVVPS
jgi:hypothetical protein